MIEKNLLSLDFSFAAIGIINYLIFYLGCVFGVIIFSYFRNQKLLNMFLLGLIFISSFQQIGTTIRGGLDPSWMFASNYSFYKNLQWGKDVIFTYGPLGFLAFPQPIGHNLLIAICFRIITHLILAYNIVYLIISVNPGKKSFVIASYTTMACCLLNNIFFSNLLVIFLPILILNYENSRREIFIFVAVVYIAFFLLLKPAIGFLGGLFLVPYLVYKFSSEKNWVFFLCTLIGIAIFFLFAWFCIYGTLNLKIISRYLFSSIQFIKGNESAMSLDSAHNFDKFYVIATLIMIFVLTFYLKEKNFYLISSIFMLPLFAFFKYAFARADVWHTPLFFQPLLSYIFVVIIQKLNICKKLIFSFSFCFLMLAASWLKVTPPLFKALNFNLDFQKSSANFYAVTFGYSSYKKFLYNLSKENLEKQKLPNEFLTQIKLKPIDFYPWDTTYAVANELNWRPRPVFQSYLAYTPWLDKANFNFFNSKNSPEYIVWEKRPASIPAYHSIDERYLFNDEPKTIFKIINDYEPILSNAKLGLLRKKHVPTFRENLKLYEKKYKWGEWIDVPLLKNSLIRAKIEFKRTLYGKINRILWKEREVFIEYRFKNGGIAKHRLVVDNVCSGVWIHPYVTDLFGVLEKRSGLQGEDFANPFFGKTVTQVRFSCKDKNSFESHFILVWQANNLNLQ